MKRNGEARKEQDGSTTVDSGGEMRRRVTAWLGQNLVKMKEKGQKNMDPSINRSGRKVWKEWPGGPAYSERRAAKNAWKIMRRTNKNGNIVALTIDKSSVEIQGTEK